MASIGDYVHYSGAGYEAHGITIDGTYRNWKSQKNNILSKVSANSNGITKEDAQDLQDVLSAFKQQVQDPNISDIRNEVEMQMKQQFSESLQAIDWSKWDVNFSDSKAKIGVPKNEESIMTTLKKIEELEKIIYEQYNSKDGVYNRGDITKIKNLKTEINKIKKQISAEYVNHGIDYMKTKDLDTSALTSKELKDYRNQLNILIKRYAAYPAINLQKGTLFENLIAWAPTVAGNIAKDSIIKNIGTGRVVGDMVEKVSYDLQKFSESKYVTENLKNTFAKTQVSQGKIDVILEWGNSQMGISAKNINLKDSYYIHVVSGSALLFLIQDLNTDYINHFLNLNAVHNLKGSLLSSRERINKEMSLILLYKGLTGDNFGRKSANIFAINDSSSDKVYVYTMEEIINKLVSLGVYEGVTIDKKTFYTTIDSILRKANTYVGSQGANSPDLAQRRISNLLAEAHQVKINASLKTSLLTK